MVSAVLLKNYSNMAKRRKFSTYLLQDAQKAYMLKENSIVENNILVDYFLLPLPALFFGAR